MFNMQNQVIPGFQYLISTLSRGCLCEFLRHRKVCCLARALKIVNFLNPDRQHTNNHKNLFLPHTSSLYPTLYPTHHHPLRTFYHVRRFH